MWLYACTMFSIIMTLCIAHPHVVSVCGCKACASPLVSQLCVSACCVLVEAGLAAVG